MKRLSKTGKKSPRPIQRNRRQLSTALIIIPMVAAGLTIYYVLSNSIMAQFANLANTRLTTPGWRSAAAALSSSKPTYGTKFSYYKLQEGQSLAWAANHFSVSLAKLQQLNPGNVVWGTTIMVPPVEQPLQPFPVSAATTSGIVPSEIDGIIYIKNSFQNQEALVTIPQLMDLLKPYGAISQLGPKKFLLNKPLFIQDNIQVDITSDTVTNLLLRSSPNYDITTLTFQNSEALIKGVSVSSFDPATSRPDTNYTDGRSFVRAYENSRMDVIDSNFSYLGMGLKQLRNPPTESSLKFVPDGGVYGISWRISSGTYGQQIVTGWVQNSTFEHNYIGGFTFGASGMMWQGNLFTNNTVYGLDPHDDSDNATIEDNRFISNGKHGFIVSKRCDYNVIKDNVSVDNTLHGFMLHDNSDYNIIENNISIGNSDNFVILGSSFNQISNNKSYNPRNSAIRINTGPDEGKVSLDNYVVNNLIYGGKKGVYLYGGINGADITGNTFYNVTNQLVTKGTQEALYTGNQSNSLGYQVGGKDRVVFGVNSINDAKVDTTPLNRVTKYKQPKSNSSVLPSDDAAY